MRMMTAEPSGFEDRETQWSRIRGRLRAEFGDGVFRSWLQPMTLEGLSDGVVRIAVPTRFMRDRVNTLYADRLQALWLAEDDGINGVDLIVRPAISSGDGVPHCESGRSVEQVSAPQPASRASGGPALSVTVGDSDEAARVGGPLDPRFTFDNFVVGKPNEFAHAACRRVADADVAPFNPLFLYGGVGLGKTHLMHAVAWAIRERTPERRVLYLSAEKFMYQFVKALRFRDTVAFKEQFRSVDVLMVDDMQFLCGRDATQEEFFHTFNALVDQRRQIVVSADKSPSDLEGLQERMRSRLGWGLVADIHPTNFELRLSILQNRADSMNAVIGRDVIEMLARRITSNIRELEGALTRLIAHSELVGRAPDLMTAQDVLRDILRAADRRITIDEIQKKVADHYSLKVKDLTGARRARAIARPRQVAMYLAKQLTQRSLPEIGRKFGDRDHTTVMHAIRKIEELKDQDPVLSEDVDLLRRTLEN